MPNHAPEFLIKAVAQSDRVIRVSVHGELDAATAPKLEDILRREMDPHRRVVLDFAETTFMDSSGLAVLVHATNDAKVNGWNLSVAADMSERVRHLLEQTAVLATLPVDDA